ncbi:SOS response-associated peptidase [Paenibacillus motobuensis]|uniref:SOS response-associated peptidase n=1 Tax=Paenibacillus TaxID=44249 RepID=UPI00203A8FAE|nr:MULTISPECIES: SOS response-associated peptidase [Paenibacillus]MCM3038156.1 SOS response-associated peptidase [Paenibacillus lutimineralis]MCM3645260.1 SOS response-associated peptidase [Paenibacillus motobuensis]
MCGRFTVTAPIEDIMVWYTIDKNPNINYKPIYNAAPMQYVPAVVHGKDGNHLGELRWGLVPSWAKDDKIGSKMINARAETITEKPSFNRLLASRRCIIPADGFYEWQSRAGSKQPYRIIMKGGDLFSFAGLYDIWSDQEEKKLSTCTIITTGPNSLMAEIHNRMPVILRKEDETEWLDRGNTDISAILRLLRPYGADKMLAYPVSAAVGNVRNNYAELLDEVN